MTVRKRQVPESQTLARWFKPARIQKLVDRSEKIDGRLGRKAAWSRIRSNLRKCLRVEGFSEVEIYRHEQRLWGELRAEARTRVFAALIAERDRKLQRGANDVELQEVSS
ncbi:MAG: hypothetical protein VYD57_13450 [Pseudomonadota bacterium]|nr:hypothetical protein [Pseudomonadota bacterium]